MKLFVLAVRDSAAEVYGQPFFSTSIGGAVRSFGDEVGRVSADNQMNKHPGDFVLYELGVFDNNTGLFESGVPKQLARAVDYFNTTL